MLSALGVKITHTQDLFEKLEKTGKSVSNNTKGGVDHGEHPLLEHVANVNKLQSFGATEILGQVTKRAGANVATEGLGGFYEDACWSY